MSQGSRKRLEALVLLWGIASLSIAGEQQEEKKKAAVTLGAYAISVGGQYRVIADGANYGFHPNVIAPEQDAESFVNQRFRPWVNFYDAEDRDHGVYLQLEIGHILWGDDFEFPKTYEANGSEVGVELRRGYLWFKPSEASLLRVGILDWHDRFGERPSFEDPLWAVDDYDSFEAPLANSVWDFNVGGAVFDFEPAERWHSSLGAMVLKKGDRTLSGEGGALLFTGDVDRDIGDGLLGASLYYLRDKGGYSYGDFGGPARPNSGVAKSSWDLWTGLRAHFRIGKVSPSFFAILNTGKVEEPSWEHTGWALKGAADVETGKGKLTIRAHYSTGNDSSSPDKSDEFRTIAQSVRDDFGAQSYWSLLGLSSPRGASDVNDLGVGLQNRGLGLVSLQGAFERALTPATTGYVAAGWLRADEKNPVSDATDMGIEVLGEIHWALDKAIGVDLGGAYLWTGDFYKSAPGASAPDNLYELYARFQLEF
ncbi:MAG: hypothetical protein BMS9Abin37_0514 [Acidobacteriota bacterium]|nr:MAG: hypothetical protein BMS9Abin37_0514 [Acidobacteriota bacterium]